MKSFHTVVASAALANLAYSQVTFSPPLPEDCMALELATGGFISEDACEEAPHFAINEFGLLSQGLQTYFMQVESGNYQLKVMHALPEIDNFGSPAGIRADSTPVLLLHGAGVDGFSWNATPIVSALVAANYDVYIAHRRGTVMSSFNFEDLSEEDFWDWDSTDVGKEDIPLLIAAILEERKNLGYDCNKVSLLPYSAAGPEVAVTLNAYPDVAAERVNQALLWAPCWFVQGQTLTTFTGISSMNGAKRMLQESTGKDEVPQTLGDSCAYDNSAFYSRFTEIRNLLTTDEYTEFYTAWRAWKQTLENSDDWKCDHIWMEALDMAACSINRNLDFCGVPQPIADFDAFFKRARELGIYQSFGATWEQDLVTICNDESEAMMRACEQLSHLPTQYPLGFQPTGLKQIELLAQQLFTGKFTAYDAAFWTEGYQNLHTKDFDFSGIQVPISSVFLQGDMTCQDDMGQAFHRMNLDTQTHKTVFEDGRNHSNFMKGSDNGAAVIADILAKLSTTAGQSVVGGCDADFKNWSGNEVN